MQRRPAGVYSLHHSPPQRPPNSASILTLTYLFWTMFLFFLLLGRICLQVQQDPQTQTGDLAEMDGWRTEQHFRKSQYQLLQIQGPGSQMDSYVCFLILPPLLRTSRTSALFLHDVHSRPAPVPRSTPIGWPFSQQKPHPFETTEKKAGEEVRKTGGKTIPLPDAFPPLPPKDTKFLR